MMKLTLVGGEVGLTVEVGVLEMVGDGGCGGSEGGCGGGKR